MAFLPLLAAVVAGSSIKVATIFAAVAAFSATAAGAALNKAKGADVWGAVLTIAFGYVLEAACAIAALALLAIAVLEDLDYSLLLLFLEVLLLLLASLFLAYLAVVCAEAIVVVSAAEGSSGRAAVSRAWRLMKGKGAQAALYVVVTCALGALATPVYMLPVRCSAATGVAAVVAYVMLLSAAEVFSVAAVTACYFECTEEEEEEIMAGHRYIKLPNGDEANI